MTSVTTIQLSKGTVQAMKKIREYPRQTYNELITQMIQAFRDMKKRNQYDAFLHTIQQPKMKELWDNTEDGEWEHV